MKKKALVWILAAVTALNITGCGSSGSSSYKSSDAYYESPAMEESINYMGENAAATQAKMVSYDDDSMYDMEMEESAPAAANTADTSVSENASATNRKLIRDMSLNVETKEYDAMLKNLTDEITSLGGYIEFMDIRNNSYYSNKNSSRGATLTARIPAAKLDQFVNVIGEQTNITNRTESVRDVTLTYVDMQSHRDVLIAERERLMEYLKQADTIEEMMSIEDHLTDIRYQIESMESQLRTFDNQVDYSTVNINVTEVVEYTPVVEPTEPKTAWERISEGFTHSVKDVLYDAKEFLIDLIIDLPYILVGLVKIAIFLLIVRFIIMRNKKIREWLKNKREERKEYKAEKKAAKAAKKAAKADGAAEKKEPVMTTGEGAAPENKTEE